MPKPYTVQEAQLKLEYFCSFQERCHVEVIQKLRSMQMIDQAIDLIVVHLIAQNFLNEERFACSFARGKHRIKFWGKIRIIGELKQRQISKFNIDRALKEISEEEYDVTFEKTAQHFWEHCREANKLKKRKKFCDFLLRKGFESHKIYAELKILEKNEA